MKMREKTKFKTVEEISFVEFDSQVQDEGQFIVVKWWIHFFAKKKKFEGGLLSPVAYLGGTRYARNIGRNRGQTCLKHLKMRISQTSFTFCQWIHFFSNAQYKICNFEKFFRFCRSGINYSRVVVQNDNND